MRSPCVRAPDATPATVKGTTRPSSSATIQRIGRTKRNLSSVQYMDLGKGIAATALGSHPASSAAVFAPLVFFSTATYSPFGVVVTVSDFSGTLLRSANDCAALVNCPSLS